MAHPEALNDTPGTARTVDPQARNPTTPRDLPESGNRHRSARSKPSSRIQFWENSLEGRLPNVKARIIR
jgi:hypothetical protein